MTHPPTAEQQAAIEAFATGDDLVIQAGAGTGKTSTLRMLAETTPRRRGLYVAFNRAIAGDAKRSFPRNVEAATAHSLAFRAVGYQYRERLDGPRVPARLAAQYLGIVGPTHIGDDVPILAPQQMARIVMGTVARFARSADREPLAAHVPPVTKFDSPTQRRALAGEILPLARRAWEDLTAPRGRLKFTHDHYLKLWQLSYPVLPCEFVLFDEAQDADPVIMSIIGNQPNAQRIVVGDSAQAIYEWRGAIDALAKFTGKRLTLSKSFRFGPAVANEANRWLDELDAPLRLEGHDPIPSRLVDELGEPDAILCRSNAGAMTQVMTALARGRRVALVGGGKDIRDLAAAAIALKAGAPCDHPELFAFRTWGEVQDYVAMDEGGSDLRAMVKLIDDYGPDSLIAAIDRLVDEPSDSGSKPMALTTAKPDVIVSTAHKAKGREWPAVLIGEDFYPPKIDEDGNQREAEPGELRLAYVAVTRARLVLDRGSLRWLDAYRRQLPLPGPEITAGAPVAASAPTGPPNARSTPEPPASGPHCPDCDALIGQAHDEDCDVARCVVTGNQRLSCGGWHHDCGNQSWTGPTPAPAIPTGSILCGPGGRIAPEDLEDGDKAQVERFARYLRERKELTEHYGQLLAAAQPGTAEYSRIADERATKVRQLLADYERDANTITTWENA
jgi:hypothetical protein